MMIGNSEVLETLYATRGRLENKRTMFDFGDWTACTCGHIYAAAAGRKCASLDAPKVFWPRRGRYSEVIDRVARALGWSGDLGEEGNAADYVSDFTDRSAGEIDDPVRADALVVVNKAIAEIERMQEQDRLDVLAQMRDVVDNAPVPEPVA